MPDTVFDASSAASPRLRRAHLLQGGAEQAHTNLFPDYPRGGAARPILAQGLLQTPRFTREPRWLSATITGMINRGTRQPGWTERLLQHAAPDANLLQRASAVLYRMGEAGIGGSCWAMRADTPPCAVLVFAETDEAVSRGMLQAALARTEASAILLILPEPSRTFHERALARLRAQAVQWGCHVVQGPVDPWPLLDTASEIHAGGDEHAALLGLLGGLDVFCHRTGLISGWGITRDAPHIRQRPVQRTAMDIAATLLLQTSRYQDPFTGRRTRCEDALELAAEWRRIGDANQRFGGLMGMSFWKRERMAQFFHTGHHSPSFYKKTAKALKAANGKTIAAWSTRIPPALSEAVSEGHASVARVEDGFVRSVGLGCDFLPPCSIVVDEDGIYFDPSRPSALERILAQTDFTPAQLTRARKLIDRLVAGGFTKYGRDISGPVPLHSQGRRRILVPGQVADDLSVRLGNTGVADNLTLLQQTRANAPDAYIVYKPHPDVDAGHRAGALPESEILRHADHIARGVPMPALIDAVDELHTMTSLAGFEALLRGKAITCHGHPFYAGWGLTTDTVPHPRRTRILTLEELAAGTLVLYPRYLDPVTGLPCPVEVLLDRLADPDLERMTSQGNWLIRLRRLQGRLRRALNMA